MPAGSYDVIPHRADCSFQLTVPTPDPLARDASRDASRISSSPGVPYEEPGVCLVVPLGADFAANHAPEHRPGPKTTPSHHVSYCRLQSRWHSLAAAPSGALGRQPWMATRYSTSTVLQVARPQSHDTTSTSRAQHAGQSPRQHQQTAPTDQQSSFSCQRLVDLRVALIANSFFGRLSPLILEACARGHRRMAISGHPCLNPVQATRSSPPSSPSFHDGCIRSHQEPTGARILQTSPCLAVD